MTATCARSGGRASTRGPSRSPRSSSASARSADAPPHTVRHVVIVVLSVLVSGLQGKFRLAERQGVALPPPEAPLPNTSGQESRSSNAPHQINREVGRITPAPQLRQLLRPRGGGGDAGHRGVAEALALERLDAGDRRAAGRGDLILELARVLPVSSTIAAAPFIVCAASVSAVGRGSPARTPASASASIMTKPRGAPSPTARSPRPSASRAPRSRGRRSRGAP